MAVKEIQQFSLGKTIGVLLLTLAGIVITFSIVAIVYSMFTQMVSWISTVVNELLLQGIDRRSGCMRKGKVGKDANYAAYANEKRKILALLLALLLCVTPLGTAPLQIRADEGETGETAGAAG